MKRRKKVTMIVTVTVPATMTAAQARREVRCLITNQCNYSADADEVKAIKVRPAKDTAR